MNKLTESLKSIGYSNKEALAYLALLELGRSTAYAVAEKSGLKKPTAHVILGELLRKGAVVTIPGAKKRMFVARSPDDIFAQAEQRLAHAKKSLPDLTSMAIESRSEFNTLYFEGVKGLMEALYYKDGSTPKEIVGFYAVPDKVDPKVMKIFDDWGNHLKKTSIKLRGCTPNHPLTDQYRDSDQDLKFLPLPIYSSEISIEAQGSFVRIIDIKRLQSVIIDNPHVAKTVKQVFELVWEKY